MLDLREIQLFGFKSFADKTTIRFDEGVTCIVGPNGCGKSNVADAVRWVLGEQSAKSLRGGNMQDVIFNGTVLRNPLSYCEVTLVFNNANRMFDIDADEVAMTRRLYRNGDSKYLINGQNSRLKDLVALFHTIGLGKDGYSIIGQGKVEQIMKDKPTERRLIFEEATGVMMYKPRKQEIERKIQDSSESLFIYRQRIDEVERRLTPLAKQAEAAREYNAYTESLKIEEANTYIYRYENAEVEKDKFRRDIAVIGQKVIELNTNIERINRKLDENREKILQADARLASLNDQRVSLSVGNERKDGELKVVLERIKALRIKIEETTDGLEKNKARISEIDDEIIKTQAQNKQDGNRLLELESQIEILQTAISSLDKKIEVYEKLSDENRQNQLSSADEISELKKNLGTLSARLESTKERIKELEADLKNAELKKERFEEELVSVKKDLKEMQKISFGGMKEFEERQEEIKELQFGLNELNQDLFNTTGQIASLKENLEMYKGLKERFDGYRESVKRLLSIAKTNPEIKKHMHGVLADIIKTEQKYETAIETAIGGAMQNIVVPKADNGAFLINYLKRINGGRATFLPVQNSRPHPDTREIQRAVLERGAIGLATELVRYEDYYYNIVSHLLGNTLVCDTIDNANTIAKKYGNAFKIVTLDGDIISTGGAMTGGSVNKNASSLFSHERKIQDCQEQIAHKQKQIERLKRAIEENQKAKEEAENELEKMRSSYQNATSEIAGLTQRENALNAQIAQAQETIDMYASALVELRAKLTLLQSQEANSSLSEEQIALRRKEAEEQMLSQKNQCDVLKTEREEKNKVLHTMEAEYRNLSSAVEKQEDLIARITVEKEGLVSSILDMEYEQTVAKNNLASLEAEAQEKELTEEERKAVEAIEKEIRLIDKEKEEVNALQISMEAEKEELQEKHQKLSEKRIKSEMEIGRIDTTLENLRNRMQEAYELDYEGCLPLKKPDFNISESSATVTNLKRKITMLGTVNPNAVEEYEYEQAHYNEMITQRDDLQKAIDDLQSALDELRAEMLKMFNEGFDKINENFKVTFKELFGGGKAELQMDYVEGEDPLSAGVEIIACPPGKKLTKISLLSGGERALTAIAILFAIIRTNPMPFCILDEIEAALDDANVDRFASYLKRFADETQFIVITHRKPTMNQADSLFGVTMQEKGISKIVSVKLAEVESKLGAGAVD